MAELFEQDYEQGLEYLNFDPCSWGDCTQAEGVPLSKLFSKKTKEWENLNEHVTYNLSTAEMLKISKEDHVTYVTSSSQGDIAYSYKDGFFHPVFNRGIHKIDKNEIKDLDNLQWGIGYARYSYRPWIKKHMNEKVLIWRNKKCNRKCAYCKYMCDITDYCTAKEKVIGNKNIHRPFCKCFELRK